MIPMRRLTNHPVQKDHTRWFGGGLQAAKKWIRVIFPKEMTIEA